MNEETPNIDELINRLPNGYEQACMEKKAIERRREIKSPVDLIKLIFIYLTGGYSQIEMSIIAQELGIANIGDTGFLKKFAKCRDWLAWIISQIVPQAVITYKIPKGLENYTITALDASDVSEKGSTKRIFRLHYAVDLIKMCCLSCKITAQNVGETLLNFDIQENWLILADRIYGTLTSIEYCLKAKANFILRLKYGAFKLYNEDGSELDLLSRLRNITSEVAEDITTYVKLATLGFTALRICAIKIPDEKLGEVERKNKRKASKKQHETSAGALEMSHYVVVITALPYSITTDAIISLYRLRWQVEIFFKRLKSIIDYGNVPLKREDSIFTWLNGKLLVSLLIEQMLSEVSFSP